MRHLAIFSGNAAELILQGKKTIESRFSRLRIAPFGVVSTGDLVYIKPSGEEIIGQFRVKKVISYDGLTAEDMLTLQKEFGARTRADEDYWKSRMGSRYGTLIFIGDSARFITPPIRLTKKDLRGWVVLS